MECRDVSSLLILHIYIFFRSVLCTIELSHKIPYAYIAFRCYSQSIHPSLFMYLKRFVPIVCSVLTVIIQPIKAYLNVTTETDSEELMKSPRR